MNGITYKDAGVDIDAGEEMVKRIKPAVGRTMRPEVKSSVGGFASLVSIPKGYEEPLLVSGTDGVGTKLKIAFELDKHSTIGIDLVAMCANDVLAVGAEPLFFLDYYACSELSPKAAAAVVEGIAEGCVQANAALVGGETAELPGFYQKGEYDLAGFVVGVVDKVNVIDGTKAAAGDVVIGLASSGLHSNGYSLARKVVEQSGAALSDTPEGFTVSLGEALLAPTRIYVKPVLACAKSVEVKSVAHITGGGLLENIPRTLPAHLGVSLANNWDVPAIFSWLAKEGPVAPRECMRTFNMGIGMTLVVSEADADKAISVLKEEGEQASVIGRVVEVEEGAPRVVIEGI
ncbi:MAG: phosphoribosylformylglycinamidine cyclo-ligase [Deltaproteobacteria bacterium]|nr:phosphoribosylformylglycinamidine cyclo-ligase [Deltaproteobacteria bacterium]MBN2671386.1 phosphoribosylformylglycinamidine cyclo-ligase [Deltaproteobacteria bacterium]